MATHFVTATTLKEGLNKFGQKSDEIISAIPFPLYFLLCLVAVGAVGQATYDYYHQEPHNNLSRPIITDTVYNNIYGGNVLLGLSPNANSRQPTAKDIDTQLNIKAGDAIFRLYESRSLEKFDYGKTFVVRIA